MIKPNLDRFSQRPWSERPLRQPSEDEMADYDEQERIDRYERLQRRKESDELIRKHRDPY